MRVLFHKKDLVGCMADVELSTSIVPFIKKGRMILINDKWYKMKSVTPKISWFENFDGEISIHESLSVELEEC